MKLPIHIFIELFFWNMLCYTPIVAIQHMRTGAPILPEELIGTFIVTICVVVIRERYRLKYKKEAFSSQMRLFISVLISVSVMTLWLFTTHITPANKAYQDKVEDFATRVGNYFESITWLP